MSTLRGTKSFYDYEISDILQENIQRWLEYGLTEMGAYTLIKFDLPTSGYTNLKRVKDDRYNYHTSSGVVYEGLGPSWVWETDISPIGGITPPFRASGVVVNDIFYPDTTSGTYAHSIDFRNGRVIFDNAIASTDTVQCQYAMRDVAIYPADGREWRRVVDEYEIRFGNLATLNPSGMASSLKEDRVWLPAVFVKMEDSTRTGLQLGGGTLASHRVFYHIFSDSPFANNRLADVLNNQEGKGFNLYNVNTAPFPYNYNGSLNPSGITYPNLATQASPYFWTFAHINNSNGGPRASLTDVYRAEVIHEVEVPRYLSTF